MNGDPGKSGVRKAPKEWPEYTEWLKRERRKQKLLIVVGIVLVIGVMVAMGLLLR